MVTAALRALADLPGVADAADGVREATARLRWHPGLRRRWREARGEAAVRLAAANAELEGAPVDLAALRVRVAAGDRAADAGAAVALAAWRAHVHVTTLLGDLGAGRRTWPPAREVLAALHRDLTADLARRGAVDPAAVGRPHTADRAAAARLATLCAVVDADDAPALVRVAVAHGELATLRPFGVADELLARAVARLLSVRSGLEPTGVAVPDAPAAADPAAYRAALAAYATGTPEGVGRWIAFQAHCLRAGAEEGVTVARAVLSGRP